MRALIVVDLGFGDCGKGLLTDFLVRHTGAKLVVRHNGGAQAGHNVVTSLGRHHTFSQFGSGTFVPGVRTFLSRNVLVHPTALLCEETKLRAAGVTDALERLNVSGNALVITPYHQALNRLREIARGTARHGSCGVGVGETVAHYKARPDDATRMSDLADAARLRRKMLRIRDYVMAELDGIDANVFVDDPGRAEWEIVNRADAAEEWIARSRCLLRVVADDQSWVPAGDEDSTVIFEGAQGVLLDDRYGFHPYTTWSTCTSSPARRLLAESIGDADVFTVGVLRTYAVRHGAGPLPTETPDLNRVPPDHNLFNRWQGAVRRGWFDAVLARYAIAADGGIDALAITHLDWLQDLERWTWCDRYSAGDVEPSALPTLASQERLTAILESAHPVLRDCRAGEEEVIATIEQLLKRPVAIGSRGPSAASVFVPPARSGLLVNEAFSAQLRGGEIWR